MPDCPSLDPVTKARLYGRTIAPPRVDPERCTGCQSCVKECPARVFDLLGQKSVVTAPNSCIGCGHCWAVCPERAVTQADSTLDTQDYAPELPFTAAAFQDFLGRRRSVRRFKKEPIPRETLERVARSGQHAPTGSNRQNVHLIVVPTPERVEELRRLTEASMQGLFKKIGNPLVARLIAWKYGPESLAGMRHYQERLNWLLVRGRPEPYFPLPFGPAVLLAHAPSNDLTGAFNAAVTLHTCALTAVAEGLGSCYLGFVAGSANQSKAARRWLGLPADHTCHGAMVLGVPRVTYRRPVKRLGPEIHWL